MLLLNKLVMILGTITFCIILSCSKSSFYSITASLVVTHYGVIHYEVYCQFHINCHFALLTVTIVICWLFTTTVKVGIVDYSVSVTVAHKRCFAMFIGS